MVCARPYLLGAGRRAGRGEPLSQSPLCLRAAGPQEPTLLPSCPTKNLSSTPAGASHTGTPPSPFSGEQAQARVPGGATQGSPGQQFQRWGQGGSSRPMASGRWLRGRSRPGGGVSRMDSGHTRGSSHRGSGRRVGAWGAPSRPAWRSLVLARPPWGLAICSGLLGCEASAPAAGQLHPGLGRFWGSDPQRHQCP